MEMASYVLLRNTAAAERAAIILAVTENAVRREKSAAMAPASQSVKKFLQVIAIQVIMWGALDVDQFRVHYRVVKILSHGFIQETKTMIVKVGVPTIVRYSPTFIVTQNIIAKQATYCIVMVV